MEASTNDYNLSNRSSVDSIGENITYPKTTLANNSEVTTVPVNKQTSNLITFATKIVSIFKRIISTVETAISFLDTKFNNLLDAIKQLKPHIENNYFKFKVANFSLIINKPVYIINY
jgi:hypothetical protein